ALADGHGVVRGAEIAEKDDRRQRFAERGGTEAEEHQGYQRCRAEHGLAHLGPTHGPNATARIVPPGGPTRRGGSLRPSFLLDAPETPPVRSPRFQPSWPRSA